MLNVYDAMEEDAYADDYLDSSQQPTQSTQQASQQSQDPAWDSHLWGFLQPCREGISRIDLWKMQPTVRIGRSSDNDVTLANMKISEFACIFCRGGYFWLTECKATSTAMSIGTARRVSRPWCQCMTSRATARSSMASGWERASPRSCAMATSSVLVLGGAR